MKRRLLHALTTAAVILAGSLVAAAPASPASASDMPGGWVCNLRQNTWLRAAPHSHVLRTLTAGRGFRFHGLVTGVDEDTWIYGHGAEYPDVDGWVPLRNTTC